MTTLNAPVAKDSPARLASSLATSHQPTQSFALSLGTKTPSWFLLGLVWFVSLLGMPAQVLAGTPPASIAPGSGSWVILDPFGDLEIDGSIGSGTELDVYAFNTPRSGSYTITTSGSLDSMLRVYGSSGSALTGAIDSTAQGESTTLTLSANTWYYVAVSGFSTRTGSYVVSINGPSPTRTDINLSEFFFEGSRSASIDHGGNADYFRVVVPDGVNTLTIRVSPSASLDTDTLVADGDGMWFERIDSAAAGGVDSKADIEVLAGETLYFAVSGYARDQTGTYTLSLNFGPDVPVGDLGVTLVNQNGDRAPELSGSPRFKLYSNPVKELIGDNPGTIVNAPAGTSILLEGYQTQTFLGEEFWGSRRVTIQAFASQATTITRQYPYGTGVRFVNALTGTVYGPSDVVSSGTALIVEVTVRNDVPNTSQRTKVRVMLGRTSEQQIEQDLGFSAEQTIPGNGSTRTFSLNFTPTVSGGLSFALEVRSVPDSGFVMTDSWTWTTAFIQEANDPNDQISEAEDRGSSYPLVVDNGNIDNTKDVDVFRIAVTAGQRLSFDVDQRAGSSLDSYLRLFDGSGNQLARSDDDPAPGESSSSESFLEYTFGTAGTYFVAVSGYPNTTYNPVTGGGDQDSNSTGLYRLTVSEIVGVASFGGRVTSQSNGAAVSGAAVSWGSNHTTTDSSGNYHFDAVACGSANLSVSASGFDDFSVVYAPTCGASSERNIAIRPSGDSPIARISFDDSTPSPGKPVQFRSTGTTGSGYTATWTNSDGGRAVGDTVSFTFNTTGSKWVRLVVSRPGFASDTDEEPLTVETSVAGNGTGGSTGNTQPVHGADPVNLASGSYFYEHSDVRFPAVSIPLDVIRHYDSKVNDARGLPFGFGWSYDPSISLKDNETNVVVFYGDGHTETHTATPDGYAGDAGVFDQLVKNPDDTWFLITRNQTTNHLGVFGDQRLLVSITDRNGNRIQLDYETDDPAAQNRLKAITDTAGRVTHFHPHPNNAALIGRIEYVKGRNVWFDYDGNTNLVAVTNTVGRVTQYFYNDRHQITDIRDNRGNLVVHNDYDAVSNAVTNQVDAFGNITGFTFDFATRVTTQVNAHGKPSTYRFDHRLLLTNVVDEAGFTQVYEYDANRNRTVIQDRNGNITRLAYDERGNVTNKTDALLNESRVVFDARNNPILRIDALGNILTIGYDPQGNALFTTNALDHVTAVTYLPNGFPEVITDARGYSITNVWENGNLVATIDALGNLTGMLYDEAGRRTNVVNALGRTTAFFYDDEDHITHTVDALGHTNKAFFDANGNLVATLNARNALTTNLFDLRDRLVATIDPLNGVVSNLFDALDRRNGVVDQRGNRTTYELDALGRVTAVTNALNQVVRIFFDPNGNQTGTVDAAGNTTTNWFDALNRPYAAVDALGNTNLAAFDALGRTIATTNANGQVSIFRHDALGRLTNVVDALGQSSFFDHDPTGNRIRHTDPRGNSWTNVFDPAGRLIEQLDPLGHRTILRYDPAGNLTNRITPNGASIFFHHDALNQVTNVAYPDGSQITFAFDPVGNRTNMVDSLGTTVWGFDLLNRLESTTDPFGQTVSNRFDIASNRTGLRYPDGKEVLYGYDPLNRMESLTNWLGGEVHYLRDVRGAVTNAVNANGTKVDMDYDAVGRMTNIVNWSPASTVIASEAVRLDALGNQTNLAGIKTLVPILQNTNINYSHDADNRLTSVNGKVVTHDHNGNLTALGTDSYRFDIHDRLLSYAVNGIFGGQYRYDGLGSRLQHTTNGVARRFVLDRLGALTQVLTDTDDTGAITGYYVYGLGLAQRITPDGATDTYHFDLRGSTVSLTSSTGQVVAAYAYDLFGNLLNFEEENPQPFRFLGRFGLSDDGAGLYYVQARFYSPALGRFLTKDPLTGLDSNPQSLNRYIYALNNPLRYFDPLGLSAQEINSSGSSWWSNFTDALKGAILGDIAGDTGGYGTAGRVIVGFIPIVGQIADIRDLGYQLYEASQGRASAQDISIAFIGFVPGVGDAAKNGAKLLKNADEVVGVARAVERSTTTVLSDVKVISNGKVVGQGNVYLGSTLEGIDSGKLTPRDTFQNREGLLPSKPSGYYQEFDHPTPGVSGAGPQRVVRGAGGELYYTPDHYDSFIPLN